MKLVFDIGGTKCRFAVSRFGGTLSSDVIVFPTPHDWTIAEEKIGETIRGFGTKIEAVCGGLPGVFDEKKEKLVRSPHLSEWIGKPIKRFFEHATGGAAVHLYNDTVAVGMGEATEGAGKGYDIVAYITVSTGVGGARIVSGKPDESHRGSEPGHQIIEASRMMSLERLVSGTAFAKKFGSGFVQAATKESWETAALLLAVGVHNTIVHWSPDVVVLGGSMITKTPGISPDSVRQHLSEMVTIFPDIPPIKVAQLGDASGLIGALALLKHSS